MKLEDLLTTNTLIPSLPEAVALILVELQQDEPDMRTVNARLASELGLTVRILRLVNSAHFAAGDRRVGSVEAATALLGLKATQQLVRTAAVGAAFRKVSGVDLTGFWRHSLDVAKIAEALAEELALDTSEAFTAGLLHGTGDLILKMAMPQRPSLQREFATDDHRHAAQLADLGYSYAEVGAAFASRWRFPLPIVDAIRHHCDPQDTGGDTLASVVFLAAWTARAHELDICGTALFDQFPHTVANAIGLTDSALLCSDEVIEWTRPDEARDFS
ncbi:MAG: HDOD domain-containing protein [Burkholderiaceae bacterium]|nr:HDOD domain-containing protein [Burkholderiaceae bacterium]